MVRLLAFLLIASSFLFLLGCTELPAGIPPSYGIILGPITDLNISLARQGFYDGNFLMWDGNKIGVGFVDINSADINWSQLVNFPVGCLNNQAVKIVGSSLVCVDLPVDTNWQTSWTTFDANMRANYLTKSNPVIDGNVNWKDGNVIFVPCNASIGTYVTNAQAGDTLILGSCTYTITSSIALNKSINLIGQGIGKTTIATSGSFTSPINITASNVRLAHLTLNTSNAHYYASILANGTAGDVLTGVYLTNLDINATSAYAAGSCRGINYVEASGTIRDVVFNGQNTAKGITAIEILNTATAEAPTTLSVYNVKATLAGEATGTTIAFTSQDSSATQDSNLYVYNSVGIATTGSTSQGIRSIGNNAFAYSYNSVLSGGTADAAQSSSGTTQLVNTTLVNGTTSGTITYDGEIRSENLYVAGNTTILAGSDIRPSANSTTAINIAQADGTDFVTFDTTNKRVGIGTNSPAYALDVVGDIALKNNNTSLIGKNTGGSAIIIFKLDSSNNFQYGSVYGGASSIFYTATDYLWYTYPASVTTLQMRLMQDGELRLPNDLVVGAAGQLSFGAAQDAYMGFDGNSLNIVANAVTATDGLELSAGYFKITGGTDIRPSANSTTAINIAQADGTDFVTFDTTNKRVGIGTTSPGVKLDVNQGSIRARQATDTGVSGLIAMTSDGLYSAMLRANADNSGTLRATGTDTLTLKSGNVGIGTTTPQNKLNIVGDVNATSYKFTNGDGNIYWDGTNLHFGQTTGIAYFDQNISATGYITRTDVYDKNKGSALSKIKDATQYLTAGKVNHEAFEYSKVSYPVSVFDKMVTTTKDNNVCESQPDKCEKQADKCETDLETMEEVCTPQEDVCTPQPDVCKIEKVVTQTPTYKEVQETGVDLVKEVALIKQALSEIKACIQNGKDVTEIKACVGK